LKYAKQNGLEIKTIRELRNEDWSWKIGKNKE
jgi:hypothetical protein